MTKINLNVLNALNVRPNNVVNEFIAHFNIPLYRNGYALMLSTGLTSALGLLYWAVAARAYQADNVGLNSMAISIMVFLSGMAQLNLQEAMIRFIPRAGTRALRMAVSAYATVIVLSLVIGTVFCLGISIWSPSLNFLIKSPTSILGFALTMVLWGIFVLEDSLLMGLRQALYIPVENAIFSVLKIVTLLIIAGILPTTGIFVSWTFSVVLVIIPVNWLIFKALIPRYVKTAQNVSTSVSLREIVRYVAANYFAAMLSSVASAVLPILIIDVSGAAANAHFYLAWIIASALQIVSANMSTSLTVESTLAGDKQQEIQRRALIGIARIVIPLVVILLITAPLILRFVGQDYAADGTVLMQLLALAALPNIFNMVQVGTARAQSRILKVVWVYGANAVMVVGISLLLLRPLGITGIGLAWLISQTVIALVLWTMPKLTARRTLKRSQEFSR